MTRKDTNMRGGSLLVAALVVVGVITASTSADAASLSFNWTAPATNADGTPLNDLGGYRIYLATSVPACPGTSFHSISSATATPSSGQTVATRISGLGGGTTYFARITAVDFTGNESACSPTVSGVAQPDVSVTPTAPIAFGNLAVGGSADQTLTVQNTSTTSVTGTASVAAPFSIVSGGSFSLVPGASQVVTIRFRPTTAGTFATSVSITAGGDTLSRAVSGSSSATTATVELTVTKGGTGAGTVTSVPAGISCGTDCSETLVQGTQQITLTAAAAAGSVFTGWSGACAGTGTCVLTMSAARAVTATFTASPAPVSLTVSKSGTGTGTVASTVSGIACGTDCSETMAVGTAVTLTATPATGSVFAGWGGACSGTAATCTWTMTAATTVTARFDVNPVDPQQQAAPVPVTSSLSPTSANMGAAATTLTVNGSSFGATSVVYWNGAARTTTYVSSRRLRAAITAADLAIPGTVAVTVFTPAPGGGTSAPRTFTVIAPVPILSSLAPTSVTAGTAGLSLTVNGGSFAPTSIVRWNGASRPTAFVSATQLRATIDATDLATAGAASVSVLTPTPGGGASVIRNFTITAAAPTTAPIPAPGPTAPPAPPVNTTVTTLAIDTAGVTFAVSWGAGSGASSYRYTAAFADGSGGQQGSVAGFLSFQLRMPYHTSGAATGGFVCVQSVGPTGLPSAESSCNGLSIPARPASAPAAPAPTLGGLSPTGATAGSAALTLAVNGSGFTAGSVVRWNGVARPTTVVGSTQLLTAIGAADIATAGSVPVTVFTPAPGGGTSGALTFTITPPPTAPAPPAPSAAPAAPAALTVTRTTLDSAGATLDIEWKAGSGATSYRYTAAFSDGSASQKGSIWALSLRLWMPYYRTGAAAGGFICVQSVNAAGQVSADQACGPFTIPAR